MADQDLSQTSVSSHPPMRYLVETIFPNRMPIKGYYKPDVFFIVPRLGEIILQDPETKDEEGLQEWKVIKITHDVTYSANDMLHTIRVYVAKS